MTTSTFKVVVLDCPFDTWSNPQTQSLFSEVLNLKIMGYKSVYQDGALPVDTYDLIATHILVCQEEEGKLKPLTGFKSVTADRCQRFNLPFPTSHLLDASGTATHAKAVNSIMKECNASGNELAYDGSWTVAPNVRKLRSVHYMLQELFIANVVHWHSSSTPHNLLGLGGVRVRTDKFFERIGFKPVTMENNPLPAFGYGSNSGQEVVLIYLEKFSEFAREIARKYESFWNNRITV
ncbi:MAG: hypothetical protein ACFUZC_22195 [Chthoniobacteraceae bacterium]